MDFILFTFKPLRKELFQYNSTILDDYQYY